AALRADIAAAGIALTYFEFASLIAFEGFARVGIDVAVIEVGLGGRLDATNLVRPAVTAITSIALDHEAWLGHDLAAIAMEKAGIVKPGVPLALGRLPDEAARVVVARAAEVGAPVAQVGIEAALAAAPGGLVFRGPGVTWDRLRLALPGTFQQDTAAVALTVLALARGRFPCAPEAVRAGLAAVRWPGRLAVLRERPLVVVDGAHNPAGATTLAAELPGVVGDRRVVLVFAVMADKDWRAMLGPLLARAARVIVTRVGRRAADPQALADALRGRVPVEAVVEPRAALRAALARAGAEGAVLVTGSLFLAGEAYAELGGARAAFVPWQGPGSRSRTARRVPSRPGRRAARRARARPSPATSRSSSPASPSRAPPPSRSPTRW